LCSARLPTSEENVP